MYIYQITNLVNGKIYIGQTNNPKKRWSNHRCCNDPDMVIAQAIKKYGVDNFKFEILLKGLTLEESNLKEQELIKEKNSLIPNGYNVAKGGNVFPTGPKYGADNNHSCLSEKEAQYILDNRNLPMYVLYEKFSDKISYNAFKKIYHNQTYTNLSTTTPIYPFNAEFSGQFCCSPLEYDQVVNLRERYKNGEYWRKVYEDYKDIYTNEWSFWNVYNGKTYELVMPEVFTEELKSYHHGLSKKGTLNGRSKLTEEEVLDIRALHRKGVSNSEIYKKYPKVSTTSIRNIINNKTWTHLL